MTYRQHATCWGGGRDDSPVVINMHHPSLQEGKGVIVASGMHDHIHLLCSFSALKIHRAIRVELHWNTSPKNVFPCPKRGGIMLPFRVLPGASAQVHLRKTYSYGLGSGLVFARMITFAIMTFSAPWSSTEPSGLSCIGTPLHNIFFRGPKGLSSCAHSGSCQERALEYAGLVIECSNFEKSTDHAYDVISTCKSSLL